MSDVSEAAATQVKAIVLLVDDQLIIVEAIRRMLGGQPDISFHYCTDATKALETAERLQPSCILQDLVMPAMDGFELIALYRNSAALGEVPVLVLSSKEDPKLKAQAFEVGANDYLVKLPDRLELLARVRYHAAGHLARLQRDEAFRLLRDSQQDLAAANIELHRLAALDCLTGIANRRRLDQTLHAEWQRGQRDSKPLALLICDVDHFKLYNDSYGHPAGDLCLKKVAAVLTENLKRPADLAARFGGEEFAIVLPDTDLAGAQVVAEACRSQLETLAIASAERGKPVTISVGVASMVPSAEGSVEALLAQADKALYQAKNTGRNRVSHSSEPPSQDHHERTA
ncbi:MAG: diguanylate cyclase [Pseudomonadota bacterium]